MCWHVCTQALLKTTRADDDCSLGGAFDRQISRFEHHFGQRGRKFERHDPIFKSSNAWGLSGEGRGGVEASG